MPDIQAFIFDMDGVIIDSNPVHREAWEVYNLRHGVATTDAMHKRMYGQRNDQIIRDFLGEHLNDQEVRAHSHAKEALYRELMAPRMTAALVPGIVPFLECHKDVPMAVATNANRINLDFVAVDAGISKYFRVMVDGHQIAKPKPYPQIYLKAAGLLGVAPAHCLVFEDSYPGVEAGLLAGMRVIGISTTHNDLKGVELSIPDFLDPRLDAWLREQM